MRVGGRHKLFFMHEHKRRNICAVQTSNSKLRGRDHGESSISTNWSQINGTTYAVLSTDKLYVANMKQDQMQIPSLGIGDTSAICSLLGKRS